MVELKDGGWYLNRAGNRVQIERRPGYGGGYPWRQIDDHTATWADSGHYYRGMIGPRDLVSEITDPEEKPYNKTLEVGKRYRCRNGKHVTVVGINARGHYARIGDSETMVFYRSLGTVDSDVDSQLTQDFRIMACVGTDVTPAEPADTSILGLLRSVCP